jgi:hypothetical protein
MALTDPPEGFNPIALQHEHNISLRGFEHSGQLAEQLEREGEAMRHGPLPGGGCTWLRTDHEEEADEFKASRALLARLRGGG